MIGPDDHRHGSNAGYFYGCRDTCRRTAHADYKRSLRTQRYLKRVDRLYVDATGTIRRIRALQAMGWRFTDIDQAMGHPAAAPGSTRSGQTVRCTRIHVDTAREVAAMFEQLCMSPGPSALTRARAQSCGWVTALAWNDIDDPDEQPAGPWRPRGKHTHEIDENAVRRVLARDVIPTTHAEKLEVVRRWPADLNELERMTGWNVARLVREIGDEQVVA